MPTFPQALLSIEHLKKTNAEGIFKTANQFRTILEKKQSLKKTLNQDKLNDLVAFLVFLEPSTRTRFSFATAAQRLGLKTVDFAGDSSTSRSKGETQSDTLLTLLSMQPDLVVLRHNSEEDLNSILLKSEVPCINAGDGMGEHPTQALLDIFTVLNAKNKIDGLKIVYVGDVVRSRVAHSGISLFRMFGAEVATCGPAGLKDTKGIKGLEHFSDLKEALRWADVCIGLRIQSERKAGGVSDSSFAKFKLTAAALKDLKKDGLIMHPGPFVPNVDLEPKILQDSRCKIHEQVTNGVYIRMACLSMMLGLTK